MSDRFGAQTLSQKSVTQTGVGIRVIGSDLQSLLPIRDRFVDATVSKKNVSAIVICICVIRYQLDCFLVVKHGLIG